MSKDIKLNVDLKDLPAKILSFINRFKKYAVLIFIITVTLIYSFLVFRINTLNRQEPSEDQVTEKLLTVKRPKIDQEDITRIQQLQDNSVEVQALFKAARENPFQE